VRKRGDLSGERIAIAGIPAAPDFNLMQDDPQLPQGLEMLAVVHACRMGL